MMKRHKDNSGRKYAYGFGFDVMHGYMIDLCHLNLVVYWSWGLRGVRKQLLHTLPTLSELKRRQKQ